MAMKETNDWSKNVYPKCLETIQQPINEQPQPDGSGMGGVRRGIECETSVYQPMVAQKITNPFKKASDRPAGAGVGGASGRDREEEEEYKGEEDGGGGADGDVNYQTNRNQF